MIRATFPGLSAGNWQTQLQDNIRRDLIDKSALEKASRRFRHFPMTPPFFFYGDNNNWFAAYAFLATEVLRPQGTSPPDQRRPPRNGSKRSVR